MNLDLSQFSGTIAGWLTGLFRLLIIILVGWIIAYVLKSIIRSILNAFGLNERFNRIPQKSMLRKITNDPSETIASFAYWLVFAVAILVGIGALGIPVLTDLVNRFFGYVPEILAAILILLGALILSTLLVTLVNRWLGDTPSGKILDAAIPTIIMSIAVFAILEQLKIAPIIVTTTYIAIIGSMSLALALAFGLGGRDVAARVLEEGYKRGTEGMQQAQKDFQRGSERAKNDVNRAKERL